MTDLHDLIPLFQDLQQKSQAQIEAFRAIDRLVQQDGYSLYWDDCQERYCIYPLPKALEEVRTQDTPHTPYEYCCSLHYPLPERKP